MEKTVFQIDDFIIARLEKFAHKFQLWTGKNNFWLARLFYGLWCVFIIITFHLQDFPLMLTALICFMAFDWAIISIQREKLLLEKPDTLNRGKIAPLEKWYRVSAVILAISLEAPDWIIFLGGGSVMDFIFGRYFYFLFWPNILRL